MRRVNKNSSDTGVATVEKPGTGPGFSVVSGAAGFFRKEGLAAEKSGFLAKTEAQKRTMGRKEKDEKPGAS